MFSLSKRQYSPLSDEHDFELFCCDLMKEVWRDPGTQPNGRRGHRQDGVDIFGRPDQGDRYAGMQCRTKEQLTKKKLTETEVKGEVEKAKGFEPPLIKYIIATTAPRDPKLQKLAREITLAHHKQGLFSVEIWGWDDIVIFLGDASRVLYKYYPEYAPMAGSEAFKEDIDELKRKTQMILDNQAEEKSETQRPVNVFGHGNVINIDTTEKAGPTNSDESLYHTRIDSLRDLINNYNPKSALAELEQLRKEIWTKASPNIKFRILTNIAAARAELGEELEAAKLFIEAYQYNKGDEKALCNAAAGHLLLGEKQRARDRANQALKRNSASTRAYSLIVYAEDESTPLRTVINRVPVSYRTSSDVSYAIGIVARERGMLDSARKWLETASKHDSKGDPKIRVALAEVLLQIVTKDPALLYSEQPGESKRDMLEKAANLLDEAWNAVSKTELSEFRSGWLANRSLANRLLGRRDKAVKDIELALEMDPRNPAFIKQKAMLLYENNDREMSIHLLESIPSYKQLPDVLILLASILRETKRFVEAIQILQDFLKEHKESELYQEAKRALLQLYLDTNQHELAQDISEEMLSSEDRNIFNLVDKSKISSSLGETDKAITILKDAKKLINNETAPRELIELGQQFYLLDQFGDASDIYEKIVDITVDSQTSRQLLNSYYRSGKLSEALKMCQSLHERYGPIRYVTEIQSAIYEEIGALSKAKEVCEEYIERHPEDSEMKIRLAVVNQRLNNLEDVDAFLNAKINLDILSFLSILQLVSLYENRGMRKKALDIMYEVRRRHFDEDKAHLYYIGLFLRREKDDDALPDFDIRAVEVDTAVLVEDDRKQKTWYLLEDRETPNLSQGEINSKHPLFRKLRSQKVGDVITIREGDLGEEKLKIIDIKSKYVYALHDSLNSFGKRFPSSMGLWGVPIGEEEREGEPPKGIKTVFDQISKMHEHQLAVEQFYKEGKLTIGAFAELIGRDIVETWSGMTSKPDLGIRCSIGTPEERKSAFSILQMQEKVKLVIDVISLLTLHALKLADLVVEKYGRMGIAQSTIDMLSENVAKQKAMNSKGYMVIGKQNDQFVRQEINADQVRKNIEYLENIIAWIRSNCDVIPCVAALEINENVKSLEKMLGKQFFDTMLVASEEGRILYSDDERLRSLAKSEFGCEGVWTQLLLMKLLEDGVITSADYADHVIGLVGLNYHYTSINKDVVLEAAKRSRWNYDKPLTNVLQRLKAGFSNDDSAIAVAVEFLYHLWMEPILETRKETVTLRVFDVVLTDRNVGIVLSKLIRAIDRQFYLLPLEREKILSMIRSWQKVHRI